MSTVLSFEKIMFEWNRFGRIQERIILEIKKKKKKHFYQAIEISWSFIGVSPWWNDDLRVRVQRMVLCDIIQTQNQIAHRRSLRFGERLGSSINFTAWIGAGASLWMKKNYNFIIKKLFFEFLRTRAKVVPPQWWPKFRFGSVSIASLPYGPRLPPETILRGL